MLRHLLEFICLRPMTNELFTSQNFPKINVKISKLRAYLSIFLNQDLLTLIKSTINRITSRIQRLYRLNCYDIYVKKFIFPSATKLKLSLHAHKSNYTSRSTPRIRDAIQTTQ
jgi:hypothetical protein